MARSVNILVSILVMNMDKDASFEMDELLGAFVIFTTILINSCDKV